MELGRQLFLIANILFLSLSLNQYSGQLKAQNLVTTLLFNDTAALPIILSRVNDKLSAELRSTLRLVQTPVQNHTHSMKTLCNNLQAKQWPLLGNMGLPLRYTVEAFASRFKLPYVTWDAIMETPEVSSEKNTIQNPKDNVFHDKASTSSCQIFSLQPDLTEPLTDFLLMWEWTEFSYVYMSEEPFNRMQRVLEVLYKRHKHSLEVDVVHFSLSKNISENIASLKKMDQRLAERQIRRIVVDISGKLNVLNFLNHVKLLGMLRREYHYLLVEFGLRELPLYLYKPSRVSISGFQILNYKLPNIRSFVKEWAALVAKYPGATTFQVAFILDSIEVLKRIFTQQKFQNSRLRQECKHNSPSCWNNSFINKNKRRYDYSFKSEIGKNCSKGNEMISAIKSLDFFGYTGHISFDSLTCRRQNFTVMLAIFSGERPSTVSVQWNSTHKWSLLEANEEKLPFLTKHASQKHSETDFINNTVRIVSILSKPFLMYQQSVVGSPKQGKDNFVGYCKDLMDLIFDKPDGPKYELHLVKDGNYGGYDKKTQSWNGIVGELIRGEADLAIAPLTVSASREKVVDFSEPFMTFGLAIIIKKPDATKPGMFSFLAPLSNAMWVCITLACFAVSLGLYIIARCSPYEWKTDDSQITFNFANCLWFNFAAFMRQGVDYSPISPGARILTSLWWLFSLLMMAYYTANLVACLSVERIISPISDIGDLVTKRKELGIDTGTLGNGSTKEYFATSQRYPYNSLYKIMEKNPKVYVKTIKDGIDRVRQSQGKYAFILESKMNEFFNHRMPCNTMQVGEAFGNKAYAVALPSNNSLLTHLKEQITHRILTLREEQELAKLYKKWWIDKGECITEDKGTTTEPLALVNISGAFYVLIFGIIFAMVVGILDALKVVYTHRRRKSNRRSRYANFTSRTAVGHDVL